MSKPNYPPNITHGSLSSPALFSSLNQTSSSITLSSSEKGSYGIDLWDCFHEVSSHLEEALDISRQIATYFSMRSNIEKEYAKQLVALAKTELNSTSKGIFRSKSQTKEKGSFMTAWWMLNQELENKSKDHVDFANKLVDAIVVPLQNFIKENDRVRKQLSQSGSKVLKDHQEVLARKEKAEQKLDKHKKELEALELSKGNKAKIQLLQEKVRANEEELQSARSATTDSTIKTYQQELPRILNDMQKMDFERIESLKQTFLDYAACNDDMVPRHVESNTNMKKAFESIDPEGDIQAFILVRKRGSVISLDDQETNKPPVSRARSKTVRRSVEISMPTFETFDEEDEIVRREKLAKKLHEVRSSRRLEERTTASIQQLMKLYESQSEMQQRVSQHLETAEKKFATLKEYEDKYEDILRKLGALDEADDSPPLSIHRASNASDMDADIDVDDECVLIAVEPFEAEAIFDFVAVSEEELSFKAGMVLRIIAQGVSGWWEAELNGAVGLVPSNHLHTSPQ